ncbi:uncharacterized protein FIBRA_03038 [Fibroporia radiculosa]|uniref:FAD/NAD(P)-binding domain-containing protein n=1 Tax=Fibroporia radiculosa TaxID=599839 RepID=J4GN93_9APHY|nr:uncharacterized protein FIBRA_03038 [Fibroporia radiculosa]CCM00990.1 predicted protein [Fibroporia radiculosa]
MDSKKSDNKRNVVVVGGGFAGTLVARALSSKLDASQYNLILVNDRPYGIHLIAGARMVASDLDQLDSEDKAFIPYSKLFVHGNGSFQEGRVTAIEEAGKGAGGEIVLSNGERLAYAALVLATGSSWSGPLGFPESDRDVRAHIQRWRTQIADAKDIYIVGGGSVGIELAGEIKEAYSHKKVTVVHSEGMLLNGIYPEKFRKDIERRARGQGIEFVFNDKVDTFPAPGAVGLTTRGGKQFSTADLVIPSFGSRPNTAFVSTLGSDVLAADGSVKVKPTLELQAHAGIFAAGDIVAWDEAKQAAKANAHVSVVAANVLSHLAGAPQTKQYKGSFEIIMIPLGKTDGAAYANILWGLMFGGWVTRLIKGKSLMVGTVRSDRGL